MNHIPAVTFEIHHLAVHKWDLKGTCKEFAFLSGGFLITEEKGEWFLSFTFTCKLKNVRKKISWDFGSFGIFHPQVFPNTLWAIWKCLVRQLTLHFQAPVDSATRSYIKSLKCCAVVLWQNLKHKAVAVVFIQFIQFKSFLHWIVSW